MLQIRPVGHTEGVEAFRLLLHYDGGDLKSKLIFFSFRSTCDFDIFSKRCTRGTKINK